MLYSLWLIITPVGVLLSAVAIGRYLADVERADGSDVILCLIGGVITIVGAVTAAPVDFVCTSGPTCVNGVEPYSGNWPLAFPIGAIGIVAMLFTFIAMAKMLANRKIISAPAS